MRNRGSPAVITLNILFLLIFTASILTFNHLGNLLLSQQAAKRWRGSSGELFAQVSCYLAPGGGIDENAVRQFRHSVDQAMVAASLDAAPGGSLWHDAFSATGKLSIKSSRGTSSATAIGIGGDYFFFHPLRLRSGSYITGDDLMFDRVIFDEELAWRLFGAYDLAGMEVTIDGKPFIIAGVVSREKDFASRAAYASVEPRLYLSYSALLEFTEAKIDVYEIVLADPISGFALETVKKVFPIGDGVIVENSSRFTLESIVKVFENFGKRSMNSTTVAFPYWENAARYIEDWMALCAAIAALSVILPLIWGIILLARLYRHLRARARAVYTRISQDGIRRNPPRRRSKPPPHPFDRPDPLPEPLPEPIPEPVAAGVGPSASDKRNIQEFVGEVFTDRE